MDTQINVTLTEGTLLIFICNPGLKILQVWSDIEPTTLDLISRAGANDLSATPQQTHNATDWKLGS